MKASEQNEIIVLGRLRDIHEALENALPVDASLRAQILRIRRDLWKITNQHWDKCNELITEDDT